MNKKSAINEIYIQDLIKEKLEKRGIRKVLCRFNFARRKKFRDLWIDKYSEEPPILQPEIDLIVIENDSINALEIKYFKEYKKRKFNYPYYKGIDQAIAYLRFGFDYVGLWQIFDKIHLSYFKEYGWRTWNYLRELKLPIAFTYYLFDRSDNTLKAKKTNLPDDHRMLLDMEYLPSKLNWGEPNPYRNTKEGIKIREIVDEIIKDKI